MKIVWLSANLFGLRLLEEAIKHIDISAILTLSDKSKTVMYDNINKHRWYKFGIDIYEIDDINREAQLLKKLNPDFIIMCGWRQVLSKEILSIPKNGVIGFHPTLLPKGRGPAPIINTLLQGCKESGVTMFLVSNGLDNGPIIEQIPFDIKEDDHAWEVYRKVIGFGRLLISKYLLSFIKGERKIIKQDHNEVTTFKKSLLKYNKIDIEKESVEHIYRKIKALSKPYKGAYIEKDGKRLIIWRAELQDIK